MNQQYKELAKQAGLKVESWMTNPPKPFQILGSNEQFEKFVELIVGECTRIIANQAWESRTAGANGDWTEYNALSRVAGQIKEHFGVEE
jgi:hypothetical protein